MILYVNKKIDKFYEKYVVPQWFWCRASAVEYLVTKILLPAFRSGIFFGQLRSDRHYYMLCIAFIHLEEVYKEIFREEYNLKSLNYYFRDKSWKYDALLHQSSYLYDYNGFMLTVLLGPMDER